MMYNYHYGFQGFEPYFPFILPFAILDVVLKGFALWKAAQRKQVEWFIALLFLNTVGILPLIYLFIYRKKK